MKRAVSLLASWMTGNAWHRGEVEAFRGHDGWYARDDSGKVVVRCGEKREEVH